MDSRGWQTTRIVDARRVDGATIGVAVGIVGTQSGKQLAHRLDAGATLILPDQAAVQLAINLIDLYVEKHNDDVDHGDVTRQAPRTAPLGFVRYRAGIVGVGETKRTVHLVKVTPLARPNEVTTLCGLVLRAEEAESLPHLMGMPCVDCLRVTPRGEGA